MLAKFAVLLGLLMYGTLTLAAASYKGMPLSGEGTMSWFSIDLYNAKLYSPPEFSAANIKGPVALQIDYRRAIKAKHLLRATQKEWQRLNINQAAQQQWLEKLQTLWPDLAKGDQLTCFIETNGHSYFYYNQNLLGKIEDTAFGPAFLTIWLSEKTREPKLRQQLLGHN